MVYIVKASVVVQLNLFHSLRQEEYKQERAKLQTQTQTHLKCMTRIPGIIKAAFNY